MQNDETFDKLFWKSLASVPGKARFEGFHLSVVGRFGSRWHYCLLHIIKLILIMRYVPNSLKSVARFPIPKSGRINEYRPISLCHDIYCFVNAISTTYSSRGILAANILHEGIGAYIKGRGCSNLVSIEQAIREDCIESGIPSSQTDEDEEKFFDRIPVEIVLAAMRVNGFPEQGFLELKASGMEPKTVDIITAKGIAHAQFVCGIEQGNPDSPTIANLVIKFKHDLWLNILSDLDNCDIHASKNVMRRRLCSDDAYRMHISDPKDGAVSVDRIGYCDDNTRYTSSQSETKVIQATAFYIQQAGDLSLVTKIGRKGSKSEIHYFNISAQRALQLKKIESIAWSFQDNAPKIELVPIKICLQNEELKKAYELSNFHEMDDEEKNLFLSVFRPKAHKHLGLCSTLWGDTRKASLGVIQKIKERISNLNLRRLQRDAQLQSSNMLCSTVHSYAPLQMGHSISDLMECDNLLISCVQKRHGLTSSDAKHPLFIDKSKGGFGFKSFVDVDVISNARELEIGLNGVLLDSETLRARLQAFTLRHNRPDDNFYFNFIGKAIRKLALYGIHVRDSDENIINYILSKLNNQQRFASVGDMKYFGTTNHSIGPGKYKNLDLAYGSRLHVFLQKAISSGGTIQPNIPASEFLELPISFNSLKRLIKNARLQLFHDRSQMYNCWEWTSVDCSGREKQEFLNIDRWKYINVSEMIRKNHKEFWLLDESQIHLEAVSILNDSIPLSIIQRLLQSKGPLCMATDGSHEANVTTDIAMTHHSTTGAAVLCLLDIRDGETLEQELWTDRTAIPVLARSLRLPSKIGCASSDISHGEGIGGCLGLEMLDIGMPKIFIMDSSSVRLTITTLRDMPKHHPLDRKYIRQTISGIGKSISGRIERCFEESERARPNCDQCSHNSLIKMFAQISLTWTKLEQHDNENNSSTKNWKKSYWDNHHTFPIFKVDSHQLNDNGTDIRKPRRYPILAPNLFMLSCNHFADKAAGLAQRLSSHETVDTHLNTILLPNSKLRFILTWNGMGIDKHVSEWLHNAFQDERIKEIRKRATQGLPWRIITTQWPQLINKKSLFNSLRGFSRTHTRSLYKSDLYRIGWIKESEEKDVANGGNIQPARTKLEWIKFLSPCPWCTNNINSKGNRFHALHFCEHPLLSSFRTNITGLLEQKIEYFLNRIIETQSDFSKDSFLCAIETRLLLLHGIPDADQGMHHATYRTRRTWIEEEGVNSVQDLSSSNIPIYGHIFGFVPIMERCTFTDLDINSATGIALGIIPKSLDAEIKILGRRLHNFDIDQERCKTIKAGYWKCWNEIKEVNETRIAGLHKIIGVASKKYEKHFRSKHNIEDNSWRVYKRHLQDDALDPGGKKQKISNLTSKITTIDDKRRKQCTGLTCKRVQSPWNNGFRPNIIVSTAKHCQRCRQQQTFINKGIHVLDKCISCSQSGQIDKFVLHLDKTSTDPTLINIKEYLHLLNKETATHSPFRTQRKRVTDTEKGVFKTISKCVSKLTNYNDSCIQRITHARNIFRDISTSSDKFLKDDLQHNIKMNDVLKNEKSYNQKPNLIIDLKSPTPTDNDQTEEKRIIGDIASALVNNQWMFSFSLDRAIRNIRIKAPNNLYIANTGISTALQSWQPSHGWKTIAIYFRSITVINQKPNGTYIIPIFSGDVARGHWSIAIICKQRASCRGWLLDSMGMGDTNTTVPKMIKKAFGRARLQCRWQNINCRVQKEVECGPRSIVGMINICNHLRNGESVETAVTKASLMHISESNYDPVRIRQKAASWMRMASEDHVRWVEQEQQMRNYLRNNRGRDTGQITGNDRSNTETITIK